MALHTPTSANPGRAPLDTARWAYSGLKAPTLHPSEINVSTVRTPPTQIAGSRNVVRTSPVNKNTAWF